MGRFAGIALLAILVIASPQLANAQDSSFVRGDTNHDGTIDIADVISILSFLFVAGTPTPPCFDALDINDSGNLDLADPISLIDITFLGAPPPPEPFMNCGRDLTADSLTCIGPIGNCPLLVPPSAEFLYDSAGAAGTDSVHLLIQPHPMNPAEFAGRSLGMRPVTFDLPDPTLTQGGVRIESLDRTLAFYRLDGTALNEFVT